MSGHGSHRDGNLLGTIGNDDVVLLLEFHSTKRRKLNEIPTDVNRPGKTEGIQLPELMERRVLTSSLEELLPGSSRVTESFLSTTLGELHQRCVTFKVLVFDPFPVPVYRSAEFALRLLPFWCILLGKFISLILLGQLPVVCTACGSAGPEALPFLFLGEP